MSSNEKNKADFIPYVFEPTTSADSITKSKTFYEFANSRRTVRSFSERAIPEEVLNNVILTASTAPSGAHKQPWTFCVVTSQKVKKAIRVAAEKEEFENYTGRMSDEWLEDLKKLGTNHEKPFLETAPALIVVFKRIYEFDEKGAKQNNYYVQESVGLATGFLLLALHNAGLVALTHTPSPLNFLSKILKRPLNERPFLLIPVGYPLENTQVPNLERKPLADILVNYK